MDVVKLQYLEEMGIDVWFDRKAHSIPKSNMNVSDRLDTLKKKVALCQNCDLYKTRTKTVFGTGNPKAKWLIIGDAPSAEEDIQGQPFVGRVGKLLNAMLYAIGLQREQIFILNILKCRPPENRIPRKEEINSCESYLKKQIALIKPNIILAVGGVTAQNLLKVNTPIGKLRGGCYRYSENNIPVMVTYHPSYLLRSPREKLKVWDDLKLAVQTFNKIVRGNAENFESTISS